MSELRLPSSPGEQVAVDSSGLVQIDYQQYKQRISAGQAFAQA